MTSLSVTLFGNSPDISVTGMLIEGCVTVLLVSMVDAGVDSFSLVAEDCVLLVVEVAVVVVGVVDFDTVGVF